MGPPLEVVAQGSLKMNGGMADEALIDIEVHVLSYLTMAGWA